VNWNSANVIVKQSRRTERKVQSKEKKSSLRFDLCALRLTSWFFNLCYAAALTALGPWLPVSLFCPQKESRRLDGQDAAERQAEPPPNCASVFPIFLPKHESTLDKDFVEILLPFTARHAQ